MSQLLLDDRKSVIPAFMEVAGGTVTRAVTSGLAVVFQPDLFGRVRIYAVRTTTDLRVAAHNSDYTFVAAECAPLWAFEEKLYKLDPGIDGNPPQRDRISMQAVATTAQVEISEVDDA